jgi:hypothetical protein
MKNVKTKSIKLEKLGARSGTYKGKPENEGKSKEQKAKESKQKAKDRHNNFPF